MGGMHTTKAKVHETKIPYCGITCAKPTNSANFSNAKVVFSIGTQMACPNPVITLSCNVKIVQAAVARTNKTTMIGVAVRKFRVGDGCPKAPSPMRKHRLTSPVSTVLTN